MLEFLPFAEEGEFHPFADIIRGPQGDEDLAALRLDHIPFDFWEEIDHFRRQALERTTELALGLDRYPSSHDEGCQCSETYPSQSPHSLSPPLCQRLKSLGLVPRSSQSFQPITSLNVW